MLLMEKYDHKYWCEKYPFMFFHFDNHEKILFLLKQCKYYFNVDKRKWVTVLPHEQMSFPPLINS